MNVYEISSSQTPMSNVEKEYAVKSEFESGLIVFPLLF